MVVNHLLYKWDDPPSSGPAILDCQESFGIFGEFYVTPGRYATMTGRGRDNTMYGQDRYIDDTWRKNSRCKDLRLKARIPKDPGCLGEKRGLYYPVM